MNLKCMLATGLATLVFLTGCSKAKSVAVTAPLASASMVQPSSGATDAATIDYVELVRSGTLTGFPNATIGKAFETAFRNFEWHGAAAADGTAVVKFTGLLPADKRPECPAAKKGSGAPSCNQDGKVTFEWTFPAGSRLFHLSYTDREAWPEALQSTHEMLAFIYG
jgi:hypothetical protein